MFRDNKLVDINPRRDIDRCDVVGRPSEATIGHRLKQESKCSNDLGSKSDEIGRIEKGTRVLFLNLIPFM